MSAQTVFEKVREFIGLIGFKIFLWSIGRTEDEYVDLIRKQP